VTTSPDSGVAPEARITVRVVPRASRSEVAGISHDVVRVRLKAPPVDGAANQELCAFIAKVCGVRKSDISIVSGHQSRTKTVQIRGIDARAARRLLQDQIRMC
jgi:uncharacterized protein